jgi:hypothetical protein
MAQTSSHSPSPPFSFPLSQFTCFYCLQKLNSNNSTPLGSLGSKFQSSHLSHLNSIRVHRKCHRNIQRHIPWYSGIETSTRLCFEKLGWALFRQNASELLSMANQKLKTILRRKGVEITGYATQYRLDSRPISVNRTDSSRVPIPSYQPLCELMRSMAVDRLSSIGVPQSELSRLIVADLSLLSVKLGARPQLIHRDGLRPNNFGCILYLSDGWSTDFPTLEYKPTSAVENGFERYSQSRLDKAYFNPLTLSRYRVEPGDFAVFREDITHRGPGNPDSSSVRYALFAKLAPEIDLEPQQQFAVHYWDYVLGEGRIASLRIKKRLRGTDPQFSEEALAVQKRIKLDQQQSEQCIDKRPVGRPRKNVYG